MKIDLAESAATEPCCGESPPPQDRGPLSRSAAVFKALSDQTRLRILRAVASGGQVCECEIVPDFGLTQPTISYHLKVLREAGLIQSERRGQWVYHRLSRGALFAAVRDLAEIGGSP